jgi:hypothetical protein
LNGRGYRWWWGDASDFTLFIYYFGGDVGIGISESLMIRLVVDVVE